MELDVHDFQKKMEAEINLARARFVISAVIRARELGIEN